jgi:N-acetylneuraminate synthase
MVQIIAEVGLAHEGSLGTAHRYIDAVELAGADAVKFQVHNRTDPNEPWRVKFSEQDKTRYDYWQRTGFTLNQWADLRNHAADNGLAFGASAFNCGSLLDVASLNPDFWKVPAGRIADYRMLEWLSRNAQGKTVYLSTGMATTEEIRLALWYLGAAKVVIMQCTSKYPCGASGVGLNVLAHFRKYFPDYPVGLSDHSGLPYPSIVASYLGVVAVEAHIKFSCWTWGPDAGASLTVDEFKKLVHGVRFVEKMKANPVDKEAQAVLLEHERRVFM